MDHIDAALAIIRIWLGIVFLAHGVKHARGREKTSKWFASIGFKQAEFQWFMSTATEIGVGALLIAGLLTTFAAAGVVGVMFVAFWTVHRKQGFWVTARPDEGWEFVATLSAIAVALAVGGPGEFSVDHAIGIADDLDSWVGLVIALGGAVVAYGQILTFWRPATVDV